jgi:hypothetical protein
MSVNRDRAVSRHFFAQQPTKGMPMLLRPYIKVRHAYLALVAHVDNFMW